MTTLKKLYLILKIGFRSVFGTTRGLQNVEEDLAFILGEDPKKAIKYDVPEKSNEKPNA